MNGTFVVFPQALGRIIAELADERESRIAAHDRPEQAVHHRASGDEVECANGENCGAIVQVSEGLNRLSNALATSFGG